MEFRVLGPVSAYARGRRVAPTGPRQARILAALLLDAGRVVPVARLVDVVWDTEPPATATRQVRNVTNTLRRKLVQAGFAEDVLTAESPGFVLRPPALDLHTFTEHVAREEYREALDCWRGPALGGLGDALAGEAARLEELRLSTMEDHLTAELAEGNDVVAELTSLVSEYPLREGFAELLMRALHAQGRQADALQAYREARRRIVDELGVEPGARLRSLQEEILRDPPEDRAGPAHLPYEVPDFTGRAEETQRVLAALREGTPVLVDGMAGVGKTALAVRAAHQAAEEFGDGQLAVDLHGYTPGRTPLSAEAALSALLLQLGIPANRHPEGVDARAALWRARTAGRKLLVLLDNAARADQVVPLLPGTSTVGVLVTSRRRLTEVDGAVPVSLDVLPAAEASELFTAVCGRADEGVAELCGHLPLAIRIAAARLRHRPLWTVDDLARRLGSEQHRLRELRAGGRDVAAAFRLSYRELTGLQQRMFRLLGLHPGGVITLPAAAALARMPEPDAEGLLEDLVDANLLGQHQDGYALHDLLAEATRDLPDGGETEDALDRLFGYYAEATSGAERVNLRAVTEHALRLGRYEQCLRIAEHAVADLRERGHRDDLLGVALASAEAAKRLGDPGAVQRSLGHLAKAHWECGALGEALSCTERQLRVASEAADPVGEATALSRLGALHGMAGRYREAIGYLRRALTLGEGDAVLALVHANLSHAQDMLGRFDEALDSARRSQTIRLAFGDERGAVLAVAQEALVLARLGRFTEATAIAEKSLRSALDQDYDFGEAWSRTDYAEILLLAGEPEKAREHAERACEILTRLNHPLLLSMAATSLGAACHAAGEPEAAADHYRLALDTAHRIGYLAQETRAREALTRLTPPPPPESRE